MHALLLICLAVHSYLSSSTLPSLSLPASNQTSFLSATEFENLQFLHEIKTMLHQEQYHLSALVIDKVLMSLKCASTYQVDHHNILTIIDYSLPSNQKRLWVFDLKDKKLLFHTYVSHGIKSGALLTQYFSNRYNSKASSIGVYQTKKAYYGRDGLSLRLDGLDPKFNDNASNRAVVMHSGWYVEENFIKKYGRPGRSWGCPALPLENADAIINTIKDQSLMVIYYPSDHWFAQSKFLNCNKMESTLALKQAHVDQKIPDELRDPILFVTSGYKTKQRADSKPVAAIAADKYQQFFHNPAPLSRMLRRQINQMEYVALNKAEFNFLAQNKDTLSVIYFVEPVIKQVRHGYYETQMQVIYLGKIKEVKAHDSHFRENGLANDFTLYFEDKPAVTLNATGQFIRWVGL